MLWPVQRMHLRQELANALLTNNVSDTAFSSEEKELLINILRFREVRVRDVMIPRAGIDAMEDTVTIGEAMIMLEKFGRSRMPIYSGTLDNPTGMIHIRDLMAYISRAAQDFKEDSVINLDKVNLSLKLAESGLIRNVLFVPPSMLASNLLRHMQVHRTQMALVIDEYGGTDGLASHEDIVEILIGDIEDEHDDRKVMISIISDNTFVVDARVELEELAEVIGSDFDVRKWLDDVDSLGGLIFSVLGRIPVRGEIVHAIPGFEFLILESDSRRVHRVRIRNIVDYKRKTKDIIEYVSDDE
nr:hemolysin family protein [Liberibacter crescens]